MKLCFFGKSAQAGEWLDLLGQGDQHSITHCTDGRHLLSVLDREEATFDWLVIEGRTTDGEGATVARTVRAMGYGVRIAFLGFADHPEAREGRVMATLRIAEKRSQESRLITCVLPDKEGRGLEETLVLYEYSGPGCKPGPH